MIWIIWIGLILLGLYYVIRDTFKPKSPTIPLGSVIEEMTLEAQISRLRNELRQYKGLQVPMIRRLDARVKVLEDRIKTLEDRLKNNDLP